MQGINALEDYVGKYVIYKMNAVGQDYYRYDKHVWQGCLRVVGIKWGTEYPLQLDTTSIMKEAVSTRPDEIIAVLDPNCKIIKLLTYDT